MTPEAQIEEFKDKSQKVERMDQVDDLCLRWIYSAAQEKPYAVGQMMCLAIEIIVAGLFSQSGHRQPGKGGMGGLDLEQHE